MDTPFCPLCDGTSYPLGQLGDCLWYRCRCCGYGYGYKSCIFIFWLFASLFFAVRLGIYIGERTK